MSKLKEVKLVSYSYDIDIKDRVDREGHTVAPNIHIDMMHFKEHIKREIEKSFFVPMPKECSITAKCVEELNEELGVELVRKSEKILMQVSPYLLLAARIIKRHNEAAGRTRRRRRRRARGR